MRHRIDESASAGVYLGLAVAFGFGAFEPASAQTFVSSRLIELDGQRLCPSNVREDPVLICQAVVDETGAVNDVPATHCFGKPGGDDRRRADLLRKNLLRSRFEPARIDGEGVKVYVSLRVSFVEMSGNCEVTVYPNLADQQGEAAASYFAPQEILTDGGWKGGLQDPLRYEGNWFRHGNGTAFVMSVAVDELGKASDGRIEQNNFALEESVQSAVESLEKQQFIPATVNGEARPARYFEFMCITDPARPRLR